MIKKVSLLAVLLAVVALVFLAGCGSQQSAGGQKQQQSAGPQNKNLILATTTSTQDTGLLDALIPIFQKQTGYVVKTVAVGTGQALKMGEDGNADVLLVHAPAAEKPLVDSGVVIDYELVMHNDFVLLGPPGDPARVKGNSDINAVFKQIADKGALFISRGDDSGTNKKELEIWKASNINPKGKPWYQETGQGMGASITVANEKQAYILSDRGTYLAQKKNIDLKIVSEGANLLQNIYHVMVVNPEKFPRVNAEGARAFDAFMINKDTQQFIKNFGVDKYGQPLFFADRLGG